MFLLFSIFGFSQDSTADKNSANQPLPNGYSTVKLGMTLEEVKKLELPEDQEKGMEKDIQDMVNNYNKKVEAKLKEKEQELLTV